MFDVVHIKSRLHLQGDREKVSKKKEKILTALSYKKIYSNTRENTRNVIFTLIASPLSGFRLCVPNLIQFGSLV